MLYNADCLEKMKEFPDSSIDMIYLDPPFFTQKKQSLSDRNGKIYEFSDRWDSLDDYIEYMRVRILEMKRILKDNGSLFLHCDTSASHYLRILLDDIFGRKNFRSEIIWSYKRWSNSQKGLLPAHQTIFYYSKTSVYKFYPIYGDYSATTNLDQILQERERDKNGKAVYKRDSNGQIIASKEKKGVPMSDVWEIPFLNPKAKERTGYPTQKPIELLERIIKISTDEGDCVLDPFCGSGTAMVSAKLLGRRYIGIDINPDAIAIASKRLKKPFKTSSTLLQIGEQAYKTKNEDELSILRQFDCDIVQRNKGIDAFLKRHYAGCPVAIRIQRNNEEIVEAVSLLKDASKRKGCSFSLLITHEKDWQDKCTLPKNMLIISRYNTQLELELEKQLSDN